MNEAEKFQLMRAFASDSIAKVLATLDDPGTVATADIPILAGLSLAATWASQLGMDAAHDTDAERGYYWRMLRQRLQRAVQSLTLAPDSGSPTAFGLWDGLHAATVEAGRIDGEYITKSGEGVSADA